MTPDDQSRFPAIPVTLRSGVAAVVRPLRLDDGAALGDFYEAVPCEDFRFYCPHELTRARALENAAAALSPHQVVLVLDVGGAIGGYAWYRWAGPTPQNPAPESSTFGICIARPYQNAGAGRLIMRRLLAIAPHVGPPVMALTVQLANPRAVALYQSMGFAVVRQQTRVANSNWGIPSEPEYVMQQRVR